MIYKTFLDFNEEWRARWKLCRNIQSYDPIRMYSMALPPFEGDIKALVERTMTVIEADTDVKVVITDDFLPHLDPELQQNIPVDVASASTGGFIDIKNQKLLVRANVSDEKKVHIMCHECGHMAAPSFMFMKDAYALNEVWAETFAHLVSTELGLQTRQRSVRYVVPYAQQLLPLHISALNDARFATHMIERANNFLERITS